MGKAKTLLTCALVCAASLTSAADEFEITVFNGYAEYENCALMKINIDQTTNQGELSKLQVGCAGTDKYVAQRASDDYAQED